MHLPAFPTPIIFKREATIHCYIMTPGGIEITISDLQMVDEIVNNIKEAIERIFNEDGDAKNKLLEKIVDKSVSYYTNYDRSGWTMDKIIKKTIIESAIEAAKTTDSKFASYVKRMDVDMGRMTDDQLVGMFFEFHVKNLVEDIVTKRLKSLFSKMGSSGDTP